MCHIQSFRKPISGQKQKLWRAKNGNMVDQMMVQMKKLEVEDIGQIKKMCRLPTPECICLQAGLVY
jgi:hypothetical protein